MIAPLIAALVDSIAQAAVELAARHEDGRLGEPLLLALDEVANIAPLDSLPALVSEGGGRGIITVWAAQNLSQLRDRYGAEKAKAILAATGVKIVFGGLTISEDLTEISSWAGEKEIVREGRSRTPTGFFAAQITTSQYLERVPVLSVGELQQLPQGIATLFYRSYPVELVRVTPAGLEPTFSALLGSTHFRSLGTEKPHSTPRDERRQEVPRFTAPETGEPEPPEGIPAPPTPAEPQDKFEAQPPRVEFVPAKPVDATERINVSPPKAEFIPAKPATVKGDGPKATPPKVEFIPAKPATVKGDRANVQPPKAEFIPARRPPEGAYGKERPLKAEFVPAPLRRAGQATGQKTADFAPTQKKPETQVRQSTPGARRLQDVMAELDAMVGLASVKAQVRRIRDKLEVSDKRVQEGLPALGLSHHLIFSGAPGTGKTRVARLYAELLASMGVLAKGQMVEASRAQLVGQWQGHTAEKTDTTFKKAVGGVLFIDEAYSLNADENDMFGAEAVNTLVKLMEDRRDDVVVIVAGYGDRMRRFLKTNEGLASRFSDTIVFPNYTTSELLAIFEVMAADGGYRLPIETKQAVFANLEHLHKGASFGNAREVRRLYERAQGRQASRLMASGDLSLMQPKDLRLLLSEDVVDVPLTSKRDPARIKSLRGDLASMIGLDSVKQQVTDLVARVEVNTRRRAKGLPELRPTRHLIFAGAPGTGKTTVARLYGDLLAAMGLLSEGQLIEATRLDMVAGFQGQTAGKTEGVFERAMGGVLFIDEAYALKNDEHDSFGQEAIDTLVSLMEDRREEVVVIVAGYTERMQEFVETNPGLASRFSDTIEFPNYSDQELEAIFNTMALKGGFRITEDGGEAIAKAIQALPRGPNFGNARDVRKLYERVAQRVDVRVHGDESADLQTMLPGDILPPDPVDLRHDA